MYCQISRASGILWFLGIIGDQGQDAIFGAVYASFDCCFFPPWLDNLCHLADLLQGSECNSSRQSPLVPVRLWRWLWRWTMTSRYLGNSDDLPMKNRGVCGKSCRIQPYIYSLRTFSRIIQLRCRVHADGLPCPREHTAHQNSQREPGKEASIGGLNTFRREKEIVTWIPSWHFSTPPKWSL